MISFLRRYQGWFAVGAYLFLAAGLYTGLVSSPADYYQGEVVRIMYVHVPFAYNAMLAYTIFFGGSVWYLWKKDPVIDNVCQASAAVCLFFTAIALVTGSLWAKPTWNTWWTWDPRLVSFAMLLLILSGYFTLRAFLEDDEKAAVYGAVLGVIGFVDLPIIHFSVEWWRTLHQPLSFSTRGVSMAPGMLIPLILMSVGTSLLLTYVIMSRTQVVYLRHLLEAKQGRLLGATKL